MDSGNSGGVLVLQDLQSIFDLNGVVYQNAVAHGWWDKDIRMEELRVMLHTELSEAVDEFRCRKPDLYCRMDGDKIRPDGTLIELADWVIRLLNYVGGKYKDIISDASFHGFLDYTPSKEWCFAPDRSTPVVGGVYTDAFIDMLSSLHKITDELFDDGTFLSVYNGIHLIYTWAIFRGQDLHSAVVMKHTYNLTRQYRHGNKRV